MGDLSVEYIGLERLIPYARNSRTHDDGQVAQIAASIREFGFTNPVLIDPDNGIIAGHGRLLAARKLDMENVPCIRLGYMSETQRKAYIIADNRLALNAGWDTSMLTLELQDLEGSDFDLDLLGFDGDELAGLLNPEVAPGEGLTDPDAVPENVETRCKPGDLWQLGTHRLLCGDSTNAQHVGRLLDGQSPLLMVTDPPYGVEYDPNWRNDAADKGLISYAARNVGKVQNDDRADWSAAWSLFGAQVTYVWHDGKKAAEVQKSLEDCEFQIVAQIIWAKPTFAISRGDYHWQHEACWYAHRKGQIHNWQGSRSESTLWEIERGCKDKTGHGTEKPVECMERPVRNNSAHGDLVCDPFLGSGSTLIACEKTGRRCFGMEIDPHYCDVILKRWEDFTGKQAKLVSQDG